MTMLDDRDQLLLASLRDGAALRAEIERLRAALEPFAAIGRKLNAMDEAIWPSDAKARFLNLDSINVGHFREAGRAVERFAAIDKAVAETLEQYPKTMDYLANGQRTPEQDAALQELVDQAQALDMGYEQKAPPFFLAELTPDEAEHLRSRMTDGPDRNAIICGPDNRPLSRR